jgi:centromere protein M
MAGCSDFVLKDCTNLSPTNSAVVLIVGAPGVGKNQLARAILSLESSVTVEVRTTTCLPLPEENAFDRPRIDFVVMMIDLANRESYLLVKKSLQFLDISFFLGKVCFVLTQVHNAVKQSVTAESVMDLADAYNSDWLSCNLQDSDNRRWLAHQLLNKVKQSIGLVNCNHMEVEATSLMFVIYRDEHNHTTVSQSED